MGRGAQERSLRQQTKPSSLAILNRQTPQHLFVETLTALQQKSALTSTHLYKEKKIKRQEVLKYYSEDRIQKTVCITLQCLLFFLGARAGCPRSRKMRLF